MEQTVEVPAGAVPSWEALRDFLAGKQFPLQMRMIDGQLAFPDESPPENWAELRLGTPAGMVTLRRHGNHVSFVTWGNADTAMQRAWNALVWAFAHLGGGRVVTPGGALSADEYFRANDLPESIKR
jgi:hypothetical protein